MRAMNAATALTATLVAWLAGFVAAPDVDTGLDVGDRGIALEGSPTSYAQFRQWRGGPNSTLELEFSTAQSHALLLYADDLRSGGQYVLLSLVGGSARLRFNWGGGRRGMVTAGRDLSLRRVDADGDGDTDAVESALGRRWHHVAIINTGHETTLVVDKLYRSTFFFGDEVDPVGGGSGGHFLSGANASSVYVGGLPAWYDLDESDAATGTLALPLVLMHPRLRGRVRGVRYQPAKASSVSSRAKATAAGGGGSEGPTLQEMIAYKVSFTL
jgi:hypothetical protein